MRVGEPSLVSQYLDFCQALASMGQTISFSLTLGDTFYFNLGTNLLHLNPLSNEVPCNSQIMSNLKKTTDRSSIESPEVPLKETTKGNVHNESTDKPVVIMDELHA